MTLKGSSWVRVRGRERRELIRVKIREGKRVESELWLRLGRERGVGFN
jgi:hypothetical protein